jgi:two-component system NtrC family sensor kinase
MTARSFRLSLKLIICLIGGMVFVFGILGHRSLRLHKQHLEQMTILSADRISDTIKRSTRYSMMKNHRDEVYQIIKTIGAEPGINKIRIFNEQGKVSFSTDEQEVDQFVNKTAEACYGCHTADQPLTRLNRTDRVRIYVSSNHERILGVINPIENEPTCYNAACHAHPSDQQVLGTLDVTMSLARVDETIAQGQQQMLGNFIAMIVIISLLVTGLIWTMVHQPIGQLMTGTQRVAAGDLDYKINVSSHNEIGDVAISFNQMTDELKQANEQLTDWAKSLEHHVEQKTAELTRAHEQMIQVERMASIGKLAAIVAHEINNPLAGILTYAKLLLKKMRHNGSSNISTDEARQYLEMISTESARCGDIVKNLLQFARQTQVNLQPTDINELIRQSIRLVQHKIDLMNVQTHIQLDERIPAVTCDAQQIKQALVALLINACEAITAGEGVLDVESRYESESQAVEILIRDNGVGMDAVTQLHIFEPFFTTKEQGRGVGLGLAVVYGIIQRHAGDIQVKSAPGQGATFIIRLPKNHQNMGEPENGQPKAEGERQKAE